MVFLVLPVDIRMSAHFQRTPGSAHGPISYIGSVLLLDILDRPINDWDSVAKRAFDIVFSLLRNHSLFAGHDRHGDRHQADSKGPVLFVAEAPWLQQRGINVYKFRSMYADQCDPTAKQAVTKGDPRVTRVGRFIRKTSIDELPAVLQFVERIAVAGRGPAPARRGRPVAQPALFMRWWTATSPATR